MLAITIESTPPERETIKSGLSFTRERQNSCMCFTNSFFILGDWNKEISDIIEEQYQRAIDLLKKNKDKLIELAEVLLKDEVIFKDNLEAIFGKRPFDDKKEEASQENNSEEEE